MGWPVICTDILPYQSFDAPVVRVKNTKEQWLQAIYEMVSDSERLTHSGDRLRQWVVDNFILQNHLQEWMLALTPLESGKIDAE